MISLIDELIHHIAVRGAKLYWRHSNPRTAAEIEDELLMVHHFVVPLKLAEMLVAPDSDFAHDIGGIHRHLAMDGKPYLTEGFLPRYADLSKGVSV